MWLDISIDIWLLGPGHLQEPSTIQMLSILWPRTSVLKIAKLFYISFLKIDPEEFGTTFSAIKRDCSFILNKSCSKYNHDFF